MTKQFILPLLLLPYWVMAAQSTDVEFTHSPTEAQARAAREGKLYFVHFTTTWCMPCQWMEENTFANDTLAAFVKDHYLAVKIDLDDHNAVSYKKQYEITAIPTLLIFNEKGELLEKHETSLSKDELLRALQKHITHQPHKPAATNAVAVRAAPHQSNNNANSGKISRPALIPEEASKSENKPISIATSYKTPLPAALPESIARFTIQVGVFSDFSNAERTKTQMQQRFQLPVLILESRQDGKHLYKVMVGKFETKEEADLFLTKINAQAVKGYVKNMDN